MQWYVVSRLSDHMFRTPEGFLLVKDVPIARCGMQLYRDEEITSLDADEDGWIKVDRDPDDVFHADSLASFHGKPITDDHPPDVVSPDNWNDLAIGTVLNARRGANGHADCVVADLLFTSQRGIDAIHGGKRNVSVGYDAQYERTGRGRGRQRNIIVNHLALVDEGRCGPRCTIHDHRAYYNDDGGLDYAQDEDIDWKTSGGAPPSLSRDLGEWQESEHPRDPIGRFTAGASSAAGAVKKITKKTARNYTEHDYNIIQNNLHHPDSPPRKHWGHTIKAVGKALPQLLKGHWKHEAHKAKQAAGALKALGTGTAPTSEQWKGLRSLGLRIAMVGGSAALGDPTGSVAHLATHVAHEVMQHVLGEHTLQVALSTVRAHYRRKGLTDAVPDEPELEMDDEDFAVLQAFIDALAKAATKMPISDERIEELLGDDDGEEEDKDGEDTEDAAEFVESKHPRDPEGKFAESAGAGAEHAGSGLEHALRLEAVKGVRVGKLKKQKQHAFTGQQVQLGVQPTKRETGKLGEAVMLAWLRQQGGHEAAHHLNHEAENYPVDMVAGPYLIEAKTGLVSNGPSAQHWRATIGQPGKAEADWLRTASPEAKAVHNQKKMTAIMDRKKAALAKISKQVGRKLKPMTLTTILNPETQTADLYQFDGYHHHIRWNSKEAKSGYVGTFSYGHGGEDAAPVLVEAAA
jgi:hypothetical protein